MLKRLIIIALAAGLLPLAASAGPPVFKCTVDGTTTFQNDPCPVGREGEPPTAQQLNAERQKKLRQAALAASAAAASAAAHSQRSPGADASSSVPPQNGRPRQSSGNAVSESPAGAFKCDGRTRCTQMTSCAEAKYFLSHCPGVKMDGNHDGIPCEQQWCNR